MPPPPTLTPTLTIDQEQALISGLLHNNADCRLPCWWGFIPGKTAWQTAQTFFTSLGKTPAEYRDPDILNYSVTFHLLQRDLQMHQVYIVKDGLIEAIGVRAGTIRNRETVYGDAQFAEDWQHFFLPQLLTTYGQPTEVLLRTFRSTPEAFAPFNLILFYPQQGILVRYYGPTERIGERIRVCPQQADITFWLWPPEQQLTLEDIARWGLLQFPIEEVSSFLPLEEATGMSLETFYQTYKSTNNRTCFETPAKMWP